MKYSSKKLQIIDQSVIFLNGYKALICAIFLVITATFLDVKWYDFDYMAIIACWGVLTALFLRDLFIVLPKTLAKFPSLFWLENERIYHIEFNFGFQKYKYEKSVLNPKESVKEVYFCVICELDRRFGRFGNNKISAKIFALKALFWLKFIFTFFCFALPYKTFKLLRSNEPLWLLGANFVVVMKNQNYFIINCYKTSEYFALLEYFKSNNITINNKTTLLSQVQIPLKFVDKSEIWSDKFNPNY